MSCSIVLIPLAIGVIASVQGQFESKGLQSEMENAESFDCLTKFNNNDILLKTLEDFDLCPKILSPNSFHVKFSDGEIIYHRQSEDEPFTMTVRNIKDKEKLLTELIEIEQSYGGNVQEYTYKRMLENLPEGMSFLNEQILDDDSILITLSVE